MTKSFKFPTPYTILMFVIILAVGLTYFLPSGGYDTLSYVSEKGIFELHSKGKISEIPATQEALSQRGIHIEIEKFKQGKIKKPVYIPGTYSQIENEKPGLKDILYAPIKGIYDSIEVIIFVLILGGFISVFNSGGTLNQGVGYLTYRLKGREGILIIIITSMIALGGTSFGLAEETFAFYPMLVPVFLAAGYDLMVPLAVIYLGTSVGTMIGTTNPFSVIIASDAAGIDWTTGIETRAIALFIFLFVSIFYIIHYAEKVKKNPELSLVKNAKLPEIFNQKPQVVERLDFKSKLLLFLFSLSFVLMILGVSLWGWWFLEMTALFLFFSVLINIFQGKSERDFVQNFISGAKDLLAVAFIIGIARGVTVILEQGKISDTILYHSQMLIEGMSAMVFLPVLALVFAILTIFIASSSGMATVTMPIIGGLAAAVGVEGYSVVNAYMVGMGLMSFVAPTGLLLPSLEIVNVSYKQWLKFVMPLVVMLMILSFVFFNV